jgi:hypothetical protein
MSLELHGIHDLANYTTFFEFVPMR